MITVLVHSPTSATVTRTPGVFDRLFRGARETTREVFYAHPIGWMYSSDNLYVEHEVGAATDAAQRLKVHQ